MIGIVVVFVTLGFVIGYTVGRLEQINRLKKSFDRPSAKSNDTYNDLLKKYFYLRNQYKKTPTESIKVEAYRCKEKIKDMDAAIPVKSVNSMYGNYAIPLAEEIIEKLSLIPTNKHFGLSREYGVTIYQFDEMLCAACNWQGEKLIDGRIMFWVEGQSQYCYATDEIIKDLDIHALIKYLQDYLS